MGSYSSQKHKTKKRANGAKWRARASSSTKPENTPQQYIRMCVPGRRVQCGSPLITRQRQTPQALQSRITRASKQQVAPPSLGQHGKRGYRSAPFVRRWCPVSWRVCTCSLGTHTISPPTAAGRYQAHQLECPTVLEAHWTPPPPARCPHPCAAPTLSGLLCAVVAG